MLLFIHFGPQSVFFLRDADVLIDGSSGCCRSISLPSRRTDERHFAARNASH